MALKNDDELLARNGSNFAEIHGLNEKTVESFESFDTSLTVSLQKDALIKTAFESFFQLLHDKGLLNGEETADFGIDMHLIFRESCTGDIVFIELAK